jgi:diketogulonate reductase-like aldo/keto reductase
LGAQAALAWLVSRPGVVIPVVGARQESQLRENLGARDVTLDPGQQMRLDEVSAIGFSFPHDFLMAMRPGDYVRGSTLDRIDNHGATRSGLPLDH